MKAYIHVFVNNQALDYKPNRTSCFWSVHSTSISIYGGAIKFAVLAEPPS